MAPNIRSVEIVIFLILFKGTGAILESSGIAEAWGISTTTGGDSEAFRHARQNASVQEFSQTPDLFNLIASFGTDSFNAILRVAFQAEFLLIGAGVPEWLVAATVAPIYLLIFRDVYYLISSR